MRRGRRVQSRRLSFTKYKGLEVADEREKIRKIDGIFCGPLQSQGNRL